MTKINLIERTDLILSQQERLEVIKEVAVYNNKIIGFEQEYKFHKDNLICIEEGAIITEDVWKNFI